ncbi:ABC transporter, permease protein [Sutterella parvirubra YIT 11816]|uniref:sn-glycerol-3-phosphate transport system permease protein UgpA n=1 Tax=Sutterella parvirubra YIT 11816 TaxID=762967 RepID=H3KGJ3_9BURK|nr:ABC transporter, permease protein [Sutterella parvirubra YIT 11816]
MPYALVLPQLLITFIFFFLPAGQAVMQSVMMEDPFGLSTEFVGLANFRELFADPNYIASFKITILYAVLVAFSGLAISLLLAVCADRVLRGGGVYKTFLIVPYAIAPAVAGVLWMFIFNPTLGTLSHALRAFGLDWNYMVHSGHALTLIVIAAVWKQVSYNFIFFLAGLQAVPKSLLEAAAMDGAGPFRRFWSVVFPLLSPTTFFLLVMNVVYAFFETFAIVDATTMGGPGQDTNILVYKVFVDGFRNMNFGGSAAQSVILMVMVIALTVFQFRFIERRVNY